MLIFGIIVITDGDDETFFLSNMYDVFSHDETQRNIFRYLCSILIILKLTRNATF